MKSTRIFASLFALFLTAALAQAATVSGTVTDKTTGKPVAGDTVELLDVQAGMGAVAHATTDAQGHYTLNEPGNGPYLIRVTHQGAGYFIAAPQGGGPGDIPVYDVASKVKGVYIEADVIEAESRRRPAQNRRALFCPQHQHAAHHAMEPAFLFHRSARRRDGRATWARSGPPGCQPASSSIPTGPRGITPSTFPSSPTTATKTRMFQVSYTPALLRAASTPSSRRNRCPPTIWPCCCPRA